MKRVIGMCLTALAAVSCSADAGWVRVAASDSSAAAKMSADYVCVGTNDQDVVQAAIDRAASDGRNVCFHNGCYYLDAVREVSDAGPMAAVVVPVVRREFRLEGEGFPITAFQFSPTNRNGVCLRVRSGVFENAKGRSVDFVRGGWTRAGIHNGSALRMENFIVYAPDAVHPYRCLDLRRVDRVEIKNMIFYAMGDRMFAGDRYPFKKLGPLPVPVLDAIALTMTDGSNYGIARYDNIFAVGFGQGIQAGGEHVICNGCLCAFGLYGWTFGNYEYSCAFNHPITLINCADEQNVNLPLFASCGDNGGKLHGLQEVTMISFNCERVVGHTPGGRIGDDMRETRPGTWRGQIGFTRQPAWNAVNSVDLPLWAEDGSGRGFRTVNNAHKPGGTTAERRRYYPQYLQQYYDTDLGKQLICTDPAKRTWVDAMGAVVDRIRIDSDYPCGNVKVLSVDEEKGVVEIAPDLRDTVGHWFHFDFTVRGAEGKTLKFQFPQDGRAYLSSLGPAICRDGENWTWLNADGRRHEPDNAFTFTFGKEDHAVRFAVSIPYGQKEWEDFTARWRQDPRVRFGVLCKSQSGMRDVELLRVPCQGKAEYLFVFTARHHACETTGNPPMEGALQELLSDSDEGKWAREHAECVFVPFMDKDGVENGDQGKNRTPWDHNRDYTKGRYASVRAVKELILRESEGRKIVFLDLHSPYVRSFKDCPEQDEVFTIGTERERLIPTWNRFRKEWTDAQRGGALRYDGTYDLKPGHGYWAKMKETWDSGILSSDEWVRRLPNTTLSTCCEFGYSLCGGINSRGAMRELGSNMFKAIVRSLR